MPGFLDSVQLPGGQQTPAAPVTPTSSGFLSKAQAPDQIQASQTQVKQAQDSHANAFSLAQSNQPLVKFEAPPVAQSSSQKAPAFSSVFPETVKTIQSIVPDFTKFLGTDRTANNGLGQGNGELGKALWEGIKEPVLAEAQNIKDLFDASAPGHVSMSKEAGAFLKGLAGAGNIVFSPITALFAGAKHVPILASIADIISAPFVALGEGATGVSNEIVDKLPISDEAKQQIAPGLGQIFALASQIELGHYVDPITKVKELAGKFGQHDAQTIVDTAQQLAEHKMNLNPDPNAPIQSQFINEVKSPDVSQNPDANVDGQIPKEVPQQPLQSNGKEVPNSRAITLEKAAVERKLTDSLGDLPTHNQMDMKEQASKAVDYIDQNPEHALKVAKGDALPPPDVLPESIYTALEARAIEKGDVGLLRELANSKLPTLAGQSLKALDSADPNSPVKIMRDIQNAREANVKPKEVLKETASIKDEIKTETSKSSSKRQSWESFIDQIKCNS